MRKGFFLLGLLLSGLGAVQAQTVISGKVYETGSNLPLEGVSIRNLNQNEGQLTDRFGFYSIDAKDGDSIDVFLIGYLRRKFVVHGQNSDFKQNFYLTVQQFALPEVQVMALKRTKLDSIANRAENASIFNYKRHSSASIILGSIFHPATGIEYLIHSGQRKRLRHFQARLINDEHDRYIESRFSREVVIQMTGLKGKTLDSFMRQYKPTYDFVKTSSDYDLLEYIKKSFQEYKTMGPTQGDDLGKWRQDSIQESNSRKDDKPAEETPEQ